jgi:hypothetical protein
MQLARLFCPEPGILGEIPILAPALASVRFSVAFFCVT